MAEYLFYLKLTARGAWEIRSLQEILDDTVGMWRSLAQTELEVRAVTGKDDFVAIGSADDGVELSADQIALRFALYVAESGYLKIESSRAFSLTEFYAQAEQLPEHTRKRFMWDKR